MGVKDLVDDVVRQDQTVIKKKNEVGNIIEYST